jgi:DNA-binding NarL/FixJ family response regulator
MFENVLIAEDHQTVKISVTQTLKDLAITGYQYTYYCDDALLQLNKALKAQAPYDLLITDLSFDDDGNPQKIRNGAELIKAARELQPEIKILVLSAEPSPAVVNRLFDNLAINAYVRKGRHDAMELKEAIESVNKGRKYISPGLLQQVRTKNAHDFSSYDIVIISQLARGTLQKDIPAYLQQQNIKPSGLSSVEKRLNLIREALDISNNEQLVAFCKDSRII